MWKEIAGLIDKNPVMVAAITIIGTFTVWMYKEFKEILNQDAKVKLVSVQDRLRIFGRLEAAVSVALIRPEHEETRYALIEQLGEYRSVFSEDMRAVIRRYYRQPSAEHLPTLRAFIELEQQRLDKEKRKLEERENASDLPVVIFRLYRPVMPIAFLWGIALLSAYFILSALKQDSIYAIVSTFLCWVSILISCALLHVLLSLLVEQSLKQLGLFRWALSGLIILVPALNLISPNLSPVSLVLQALATIVFIRVRTDRDKLIVPN